MSETFAPIFPEAKAQLLGNEPSSTASQEEDPTEGTNLTPWWSNFPSKTRTSHFLKTSLHDTKPFFTPSSIKNMKDTLLLRALMLQDVQQGRYDKDANYLKAWLLEKTKAYNEIQRLL